MEIDKSLENEFRRHLSISENYSERFLQLIWKNPKEALDNFFDTYNKALDKAYTNPETGENNRSFVEIMAGGPHEAIPSSLYNSVGLIYPFLNRTLKNYSLEKILGILNGIRYDYVQISHTSFIREPLLLSDISIIEPLYWPGMAEGERLINQAQSFGNFKKEFLDLRGFFKRELINSDFIVAYSLLRKDFCDWGEEYLKIADPFFIERVIKGVVGKRFSKLFSLKNLTREEIEGVNTLARNSEFYSEIKEELNKKLDLAIYQKMKRLEEVLPLSLKKTLTQKIEERDWTDSRSPALHKI
jgi:hypothetical protein